MPRTEAPEAGAEPRAWRLPDLAGIEEFLQLVARAVRQFRTYPPTSPLCVDAIAACHTALVSRDGRDQIVVRVTPRELLVDEVGVGAGTIVEHELVRRLHRARVAAVTIDRAASPRDLSRFCSDLIAPSECGDTATTFAERLVEHGIDKIVASMAHQPEVLDVGAPAAPLCDLVERERSRRDASLAADRPAIHLYPPDKGWVRLDPAARFSAISLVDLAILVDNPADIAAMLLRLTDDGLAESDAREAALEKKFSEVALLFSSLDPRLARVMFAKLARAVLDLGPERRTALLRRTILPGLLDGRVDGAVLKDFPDVDLAESLCLLLDLETAAPEMLSAALDRLELPAERRRAMVPLLEARVQARDAGATPGDPRREEAGVDRYARRLVRIDPAGGKSFAEFMAFDLSIDAQTSAAIARIRDEIATTDHLGGALGCLSSLLRLEPNPGLVERFLTRVSALLVELERASRWRDLAAWIARQRQLADALRQPRPDVADAISAAIGAFCTRDRLTRLLDLYDAGGEGRAAADALVDACGAAIAPACVALLDDPAVRSRARSLVQLMCDHAELMAPELAARSGPGSVTTTRALVRVLGFAGPGYEAAIARHLGRRDEQTVREALRALARIGTAEAAAIVAAQIRQEDSWVRGAAEETLWRLPQAQAEAQLRDLLGRRDFVLRHPDAAARLLDRAAQTGADGLAPALSALAPLRFRFWNRALMRIGRKAGAWLER